jgi:hypothetical protein
MAKNYAYHSGSFMALSKMFAAAVRELEAAEDDFDRKWAMIKLRNLVEQTEDTLVELGYEEETV